MKVRTTKKVAAGLVVSAAMAVGLAVSGAGTAAAAETYDGPTLSVDQGDFDGKNLELSLTNPKAADGLLAGSVCTSALLDGAQGLEALVAYGNNDFGKLVEILASPGLNLGPTATNTPVVSPGPNTATKAVDVPDGVYIYLGTCGGVNSALDPTNIGVSILPVIVPSGFGSVAPALDFGSTVLEAGDDLASLLPLLAGLI